METGAQGLLCDKQAISQIGKEVRQKSQGKTRRTRPPLPGASNLLCGAGEDLSDLPEGKSLSFSIIQQVSICGEQDDIKGSNSI